MKKTTKSHLLLLAGISLLAVPATAQSLFVETFDVDPTGSWTVNNSTANPTGNSADLFFDYSTVGIPSAPNSLGGSTRGLKMTANVTGGLQTGISVSPTGVNVSGDYKLSYDSWQNYNGPLAAGGSGSTQMTGAGIGTAGTSAQWAGGPIDSVFFSATGEGGSSIDYRAYVKSNPPAAGNSGVYAAGSTTTPDPRNSTDPFYSVFGGESAPAAQLSLYPQQTEVTPSGGLGFAWRTVEIEKIGNSVSWSIDGLRIATADISSITLGGGNILFTHFDINNGSSTDPNFAALNFGLIDNVMLTQVPEPSTLALLGLAGFGLAARRIFRRK